jgi:hypothetical protein
MMMIIIIIKNDNDNNNNDNNNNDNNNNNNTNDNKENMEFLTFLIYCYDKFSTTIDTAATFAHLTQLYFEFYK